MVGENLVSRLIGVFEKKIEGNLNELQSSILKILGLVEKTGLIEKDEHGIYQPKIDVIELGNAVDEFGGKLKTIELERKDEDRDIRADINLLIKRVDILTKEEPEKPKTEKQLEELQSELSSLKKTVSILFEEKTKPEEAPEGAGKFPCPICGTTIPPFDTKEELEDHMQKVH